MGQFPAKGEKKAQWKCLQKQMKSRIMTIAEEILCTLANTWILFHDTKIQDNDVNQREIIKNK